VLTVTYSWAPGATSSLLAEKRAATPTPPTTSTVPGGVPVEQVNPDGSVYWLHHDQLGSIRMLTTSSSANIGTASFDAYGATPGTVGVGTGSFGYAAQYTDTETGFQYLRARYYDPATGQFLTRDPAVTLTRSPYGYVDGSPLNLTDPNGMNWLSDGLSDAGNAAVRGAQAVGRAASDVGRGARAISLPFWSALLGTDRSTRQEWFALSVTTAADWVL